MIQKRKCKIAIISVLLMISLIFGRCHQAIHVHADEADLGMSASFVIDNKNVYSGMKTSYSKGYLPTVSDKNAVLVLPLLSSSELMGNRIRASLKLGESENFPIVCKNYEKSVKLANHKTRSKSVKCYLLKFNF